MTKRPNNVPNSQTPYTGQEIPHVQEFSSCPFMQTDLSPSKANKDTFSTGAQKELKDKPRFDLIPPEVKLALAEIYSLGAKKYDDRNWEKGIPFSQCIAAHDRHINSFELGQMYNEADGGYEHIGHAMWWLAAMLTYIRRGRTDLNDLVSYSEEPTAKPSFPEIDYDNDPESWGI